MVQNAAARLLTQSSRTSHITPILAALHWLPIKFRIQFMVLVVTYRAQWNVQQKNTNITNITIEGKECISITLYYIYIEI